MQISDIATKMIGDKRRWRAYKARTRALPQNYREAVEAIERYLMYFGPENADDAASMYEDLADLFEQAAADEAPIREIVGADPVEFVETFLQNYTEGGWITRERMRLTEAVERAAGQEPGTPETDTGEETSR